MVRLSDGGVVIGGDFDEAGGATRNALARLHSGGSLDTAWHPAANGQVQALAVDGSDNVYAAGDFTLIGGQSHAHLARIDAAGSVDAGFSIAADDSITALAYDGNGHLYVGGFFMMLGGQAHTGLARITLATKSVDASWNVDASTYVYALQADANFLYVAEYASLRRVSAAGVVDAGWSPAPDGAVQAMVLAPGKLYVGGNFGNVAGASRSHLARFATTGSEPTLDAGWTPAIDGPDILTLAADGSGNLYIGGSFGHVAGTGTPLGLAKISDSGSVIAGWSPDFGGAVGTMLTLADGRLLVGGLVFPRSGPQQAGLLRLAATDG